LVIVNLTFFDESLVVFGILQIQKASPPVNALNIPSSEIVLDVVMLSTSKVPSQITFLFTPPGSPGRIVSRETLV